MSAPASGYPRWMVIAAIAIVSSTFGLFFSFGVFYDPLLREFGWTKAQTGSIISIASLFQTISGIVMGWVADRRGPRVAFLTGGAMVLVGLGLTTLSVTLWQWYLLYGVLGGWAWGTAGTIPVTMAVRRFGKIRGVALGIVAAGSGVGSTVLPTTSAYLITLYGWRQALLTLAVAYSLIFLFVALVSGEKKRSGVAAAAGRQVSVPQAGTKKRSKKPVLFILFSIFLLPNFSLFILYTYLPPLSLARGIPPIVAASVLSVMSGCSIVARLGSFLSVRRIGGIRSLVIAIALMTATVFVLSGEFDLVSMFLLVPVFGLGYGLWIPMTPTVTAEFFDGSNYGRIWGMVNAGGGLGGLIGPLVAGELLDLGVRDVAILQIAGVANATATLLALLLYYRYRRESVEAAT